MPTYKHNKFFAVSNSIAFDNLHNPGVKAPYAGIYRCYGCGHEIAIAEGHTLPPQHDRHHPQFQAVKWQLVAAANHHA